MKYNSIAQIKNIVTESFNNNIFRRFFQSRLNRTCKKYYVTKKKKNKILYLIY